MKVGVGKAKIHINHTMLPLESFTSVHDDIHMRMLWLSEKIDFIILSIEMTSLREDIIDNLKKIINEQTHVDINHIMISVTHSFSSPHTRSTEAVSKMTSHEYERYQSFLDELYKSLIRLIKQARNKEQAYISYKNAYCSVNVSRDMCLEDGWWLGANDLGISDKSVNIIRIDNQEKKLLCVLYSYDIQSSIMDHSKIDDGYQITSDLVGKCSDFIEKYLDTTAIYMLGCSADQSPLFKANHNFINKNKQLVSEDIGKDGYVFVNAFGKKLAYAVINNLDKVETSKYQSLAHYVYEDEYPGQVLKDNISPTKTYEFIKDGYHKQSVEILALGDIAIVGVKPELCSSSGINIKSRSPFHQTFVCTMINGCAKYMPDQLSYDRITYEAQNSMFARGSAEQLVENIVRYLKELKEEK